MSAHQELEDWRQTFCRRIRAAADRLCSNVPLNTTVRAHCREFKRLLADNAWFLDQTIQLSRFEFQVVSIASTKKELEGDLRFFSAAEVRRALERRPDDETRLQVQELIYNSQDDREKTIVVRAYESTSEEPRPSLFANDQPRLAPIDDVRRGMFTRSCSMTASLTFQTTHNGLTSWDSPREPRREPRSYRTAHASVATQ